MNTVDSESFTVWEILARMLFELFVFVKILAKSQTFVWLFNWHNLSFIYLEVKWCKCHILNFIGHKKMSYFIAFNLWKTRNYLRERYYLILLNRERSVSKKQPSPKEPLVKWTTCPEKRWFWLRKSCRTFLFFNLKEKAKNYFQTITWGAQSKRKVCAWSSERSNERNIFSLILFYQQILF